MAIEDYYTDLILKKVTETPDGRGGTVNTTNDVAIKGRITLAGSAELELARKLDISASHNMYCPVSVDINREDRVEWNGDSYQVVSKPQNTVGRNHHLKILVNQILNE